MKIEIPGASRARVDRDASIGAVHVPKDATVEQLAEIVRQQAQVLQDMQAQLQQHIKR